MRMDLLLIVLHVLRGLFGLRSLHREHPKFKDTARIVAAYDKALDTVQDVLDQNYARLTMYHFCQIYESLKSVLNSR